MSAQTPTTKKPTQVTLPTRLTTQCPIAIPLRTVTKSKVACPNDRIAKPRTTRARQAAAAVQAVEARANLAQIWEESMRRSYIVNGGSGNGVSNDPYKAKREREKIEARKRRVQREGRRRRFEEMRGGKWEVGRLLD
ncbi:hypothetical protein VE03_05799 [Pseudogymnoascus sp. 23342-1-I1]|nr:hypothetical protein VE03_05799 [Pseudogymnoascus sp. 23342-1-I1]